MTVEQRISTFGCVGVIENRGFAVSHQKPCKSPERYMAKIMSLFMPYVLPSVPEKDYFLLQEKLKNLLLEYKREEEL